MTRPTSWHPHQQQLAVASDILQGDSTHHLAAQIISVGSAIPYPEQESPHTFHELRDNRVRISLVLLFALLTASCTGFREGMPGVFRSPFPQEEQLIRRIKQHDIQTVLCLRNGRTARQTERATQACNAQFLSLPISAKRPPHPEALLEIWRIADEAKRPILVHCRAGVDRTGLVLALIALHDHRDLPLARAQLAFIPNGHLAVFGTEAMDHVIDQYAPFLGILPFPAWVERVYAVDYHASAESTR